MNVQVIDPIEYGRVGERPLLATFYRPERTKGKAVPVIVWIHGGAWWAGDRHGDADACQHIARHGLACLSIDYRLSPEAIFPAAIEDCKCAVRYLRAHAADLGILPEKIGAWGPSAGGHLAALLGTSSQAANLEGGGGWPDYSSAVQAVCDWFGPSDFSKMSAFPGDGDHDAADSPESQFIGGSVQQHPDRVQRANPIPYISAATPPFLIAHGTDDRIVPFNQSELLHDALRARGLDVTFEVLEGAGHGGPGFEPDGALFDRCLAFFDRHLK